MGSLKNRVSEAYTPPLASLRCNFLETAPGPTEALNNLSVPSLCSFHQNPFQLFFFFPVLISTSPLVINNYVRDSKRCPLFQRDCMCSANLHSLSKLLRGKKIISNAQREFQILLRLSRGKEHVVPTTSDRSISSELHLWDRCYSLFQKVKKWRLSWFQRIKGVCQVNWWHSWNGLKPDGLFPKSRFSLLSPWRFSWVEVKNGLFLTTFKYTH